MLNLEGAASLHKPLIPDQPELRDPRALHFGERFVEAHIGRLAVGLEVQHGPGGIVAQRAAIGLTPNSHAI